MVGKGWMTVARCHPPPPVTPHPSGTGLGRYPFLCLFLTHLIMRDYRKWFETEMSKRTRIDC